MLTTRYVYNSLNQLKWQSTPDAGVSKFWYDALGRLVVSQNAQQNDGTSATSTTDPQYFSYTALDNLGRISEVGELQTDEYTDANVTSAIAASNVPGTWADSKRQITKTQYDTPLLTGGASPFGTDGQNYLRFRVADVTIDENGDGTYEYATHYSYDIHGNVNNLIQDNPTLAGMGEQFKQLKYEYDLISGNVKKVSYQQGDHDEFYHKYYYDADNRILEAWTSRDNYIWERDARYTYYRHGPLARVEVGDLIVQGTDYAYTLQGWLKGVNAGGLVASKDMGLDGKSGDPHKAVANDAYGFILDYYTGDYTQISTTASSFIPNVSSAGGYSYYTPDLFNGNIRAMSTALMKPTVTSGKHDIANVLGKAYRYDQLNRIYESWSYEKAINTSATFTWVNSGAGSNHSTPKWNTAYTYDANGNILTMKRAGDLATSPSNTYDMDQFTYTYYADCNRLRYVKDTKADGTYSVDVDNQESVTGVDNTTSDGDPVNDVYSYDKIGNLIRDDAEKITNITWNVYGKITKIEYSTSSTRGDIEFAYDPMGNRIMKKVTPKVTTDETVYTYYTRDAQGNVMATYTRKVKTGTGSYDNVFISEQHIYGSSRLGYVTRNKNMEDTYSTSANYKRTLGDKRYELSNHLGNVLVVITDRRLAQQGSGASAGKIVGYEPDVVTAQDYDPFGMMLSGRNWTSGSGEEYRFGFNGKENTDEIYGDDNAVDFGARMFNNQLGRWFSVDLQKGKYPSWSPYHFGYNNPIITIDPNGEENIIVVGSDTKKNEHGIKMRNKFINGSARFYNRFKQVNPAEETTILVYYDKNSTADELEQIKKRYTQKGVDLSDVIFISNAKEIIDYMNNRPTTMSTSDGLAGVPVYTFSKDLITDFVYVGHGYKNNLLIDLPNGGSVALQSNGNDIFSVGRTKGGNSYVTGYLDDGVFSDNACITLATCRAEASDKREEVQNNYQLLEGFSKVSSNSLATGSTSTIRFDNDDMIYQGEGSVTYQNGEKVTSLSGTKDAMDVGVSGDQLIPK